MKCVEFSSLGGSQYAHYSIWLGSFSSEGGTMLGCDMLRGVSVPFLAIPLGYTSRTGVDVLF